MIYKSSKDKKQHGETHDWSELKEILSKDNPKSIFLGNGFNLSLGINTSYLSIYESVRSIPDINKILKKNNLSLKKVKKEEFNLERLVCKIKDEIHQETVLRGIYQTVLDRCKKPIKEHKTLMNFFESFDNFFTTNYDPLLYRFLLNFKSAEDTDELLTEDIRMVNNGSIIFHSNNEEKKRPLAALTKRDVYSIAKKIFEDSGSHPNAKREDYYNALKIIRNELPNIKINDGFGKKKNKASRYVSWVASSNSEQNIFYLHGALNIYQEVNRVKKFILGKNSRYQLFINEILKQSSNGLHFCVFERRKNDKIKKIRENIYLSHCLEKLSKIEGILVILGWACSSNDGHLIEKINENSTSTIIIFYYSDKDKSSFIKSFPGKELFFFRSQILPFFKKER